MVIVCNRSLFNKYGWMAFVCYFENSKGTSMNREDIIRMALECGWSKEYLEIGDERLERFAALVEEHIYAKQLELPEPRLTGKFSLTAGKFKCTGCTGTWTDREDAKHHSCRDYQ